MHLASPSPANIGAKRKKGKVGQENNTLYAHPLKVYPVLQKNAQSNTQEMIECSPFMGKQFVLKPVSVWTCFPRPKKKVHLV